MTEHSAIIRAFVERVRQRHKKIFDDHPDPVLREREPYQVWDALLNEAILAELAAMEKETEYVEVSAVRPKVLQLIREVQPNTEDLPPAS